METNFFGPLNIIRKIVPAMRERRSGVIVNVSSTAGIEAKPSRSMYSGSKFALEGMFHLIGSLGWRWKSNEWGEIVECGLMRYNSDVRSSPS